MSRLKPAAAGWAVTAFATLGYAVNSMNQQVIFLLGQQIKIDLQLNDTQLGFLFGLSYMAFSALSALPLGRLADIMRRRLVVGFSLGVMAAASALTALSSSFLSLIGLRAIAGAGDGGIVPASTAMIGASVSAARRPLSLSIFNAGSALGAFLCYRYAGALAEAEGWRSAYLAVGVLGLIVACLIAMATPDRPGRTTGSGPPTRFGEALGALAHIAAYRQIVLAFIATGFVSAGSWSWISLVLQRGHGFSVESAGACLSIGFGIATVMGSLCYGLLASKLRTWDTRGPLLAGIAMQVASSSCFLLALTSVGPGGVEILLFASLFFAGSGMVVVFNTLQDILPDEERATGVGLAMLLFSLLGQGLGPLVTGGLSDVLSVTLGASSLATVVCWIMGIGSLWVCAHLLATARLVGRPAPAVLSA